MIEVLLQSLSALFEGGRLAYLALGVVLGFAVGILPGLGGIVGFSILLPFLYGMDAASALAMLIGLVAVVPTADTMTSVLMGIPGSSSSQATVVDGFPLAKRGEGARALSAAYFSSLLGGLFGALVLTVFIIAARPLILLMGSAELFMLGLLGVAMVGLLSGRDIFKGVAACGFGLLLGALGNAPATGEWRMTFGSAYLYDGLKLVVVGLAVFAVPEIVDLLARARPIADSPTPLGKGWRRGLRDAWICKWLIARCSAIGCVIGALPGLGGSVVDWIAYGHVVQSSRDRSQFGRGDIRGVIAPESANNAKEGGGLIPTLLFGVPGSGSMAVFLGGLTLLGIEPGPSMVGENLRFAYVIVWSLALANVLGAGLCVFLSPHVAKLTRVPYGMLAPFMLMIIFFAVFQAGRQMADIFTLMTLGAVAVLMKRNGWSRPALLVGFVLSDTLETYLYQAVQFYGAEFVLRPGALMILALSAAAIFSAARYHRNLRPERAASDDDDAAAMSGTADWRFTWGLALFFAVALADSLQHSFLGAVFPAGVSAAMLALCAALLMRAKKRRRDGAKVPRLAEDFRNLGWPVLLAGLTGVVGFVLALPVFFAMLIRRKSSASWGTVLALTGCGMGFILLVAKFARMDFPWGLLQYGVELPWPLG